MPHTTRHASPSWGIPLFRTKIKIFIASLIRKGLVLLLLSSIVCISCGGPAPVSSTIETTKIVLIANEPGIYQVRYDDLKRMGFFVENLNENRLRLTLRGLEQPFIIEENAAEPGLIFFSRPVQSRFTRNNFFVLELLKDNPAPASNTDISNAAILGPGEPATTARVELSLGENLIYNPQAEVEDHWLWHTILGNNEFSTNFNLPGLVDDPSELQIQIWSNSQATVNPDHHVIILVNQTSVADISWDGRGAQVLLADIPSGILQSEKNILTIQVPGDTGAAAELVHLDKVIVSYTRSLSINDDQFAFQGSGSAVRLTSEYDHLAIAGLSHPDSVPSLKWIQNDKTTTTEPNTQYWVAAPGRMFSPEIRSFTIMPDLKDSTLAADYIAIGPHDLLEPLKPLMDFRESQGLKVLAIPLEAIYDQFGAGFPEPQAIQSFLRSTLSWAVTPRMLLLLGDASYDPAGFISSSEINRLPSFFVQTDFGGETASDLGFSFLDSDELPDLAVGRLPASTPGHIEQYVAKLLAYEASQPANPRKVLAVSDGTEPTFEMDAQDFLDQLGSTEDARMLAALPGDNTAAEELRRSFEQGQSLVAYFGHGSVTLWGKDKIFSAEEAANLSNQRFPVVMTMTCLNGLYTHPRTISLAESLLWSPNGGAIAVLAPSSLTLAVHQAALRRPFIEALLQPNNPVGQALLSAQRSVMDQSAALDEVVATFLLFGDPAIHLK
jgi:hypothetical protein